MIHIKYPDTCSIERAFGGATVASNVPCRVKSCIGKNINFGFKTDGGVSPVETIIAQPTHVLYCESNVDIRDGVTRVDGKGVITFADGDGVTIPSGGSAIYAVVFVEVIARGTFGQQKRVYLIRDAVTWTGADSSPSPDLHPTPP